MPYQQLCCDRLILSEHSLYIFVFYKHLIVIQPLVMMAVVAGEVVEVVQQ